MVIRVWKEVYNRYDFLKDSAVLNESEKKLYKHISVEVEDNKASIRVRKASYEASESLFSDLNNLEVVTTTSDKYEECIDQQTVARG